MEIKKLAELQLKEEQNGVAQSSKQDRNARASREWNEYLTELELKMKKDTLNLVKRENAQIVISAWQTSTKKRGSVSQKQDILNHLKKHRKINGLDALKLYGCFRLPTRILELKEEKHNIDANLSTLKNGRK